MVQNTGHGGLENLTEQECWLLLEAHHIGRLGVLVDDHPEIYPVNYVVDHRSLVFQTSVGTKFAGAVTNRRVAFEIDAADPLFHTGWSVMVKGDAAEIDSEPELRAAQRLKLSAWAAGDRLRYVRIEPTAISGRRIVRPGHPLPGVIT